MPPLAGKLRPISRVRTGHSSLSPHRHTLIVIAVCPLIVPVPSSSLISEAPVKWYNCNTIMRFSFDAKKSGRLRANPRRGIGFEEAREQPYYLDHRSDSPEQFIAIGWI